MGKNLPAGAKIGTLLFLVSIIGAGCRIYPDAPAANTSSQPAKADIVLQFAPQMARIAPFFKPMGKPRAYDWLGSHNEPGQTFEEYVESSTTKPTGDRQKIYIVPLGKFTSEEAKVIDVAAGYLSVFYDLPVEKMPGRTVVAEYPNFRYNNYMHRRQVKTGFFLDDVLPKLLPSDAAALIAFTNEDLYPDDSMNYVFGQASFDARVGIWSLARLHERASSALFLHRVLKIAAHETGHMFSM